MRMAFYEMLDEYTRHRAMNGRRDRGLKQIENSALKCDKKEDLMRLVKNANACNVKYPYSSLPYKINYGLFLIIFGVICYLYMSYIYAFLIFVGVASLYVYKSISRFDANYLTHVSQTLYRKNIEIEYKLDGLSKSNKKRKLEHWQSLFVLFNEGDKNISLNFVWRNARFDKIPCEFFDYEYETESTSGSGNEETKSTMHYRHYGFVFPFEYDPIAVFSSLSARYTVRWDTESKKFNKVYSVSAKKQNVPPKFLSPAVIILFLDIARKLKNCNFEVSNGYACLSFEDRDFLVSRMKNTLSTFDEYYQEIKQTKKSAAIENALEFISELGFRKSTGEGVEQ